MADQTTPIADAAKALLDAWAAFKELAGDEERDAVCSVCGRHPCGQLSHADDCPMRALGVGLGGGGTPADPGDRIVAECERGENCIEVRLLLAEVERLRAAAPQVDAEWLRACIVDELVDYLPDAIAYQWASPVAATLVERLPHVFAGQLTASAIADAIDEAQRRCTESYPALSVEHLAALAAGVAELVRAAAPAEGRAVMSGFDIFDEATGEPLAGPIADARAAAGAPPPTPGPTREQVAEAIGAVLRRGHSQGPWLDGAMWEAADAVMALLSTQPATAVLWEGPTMQATRRNSSNTGDTAIEGHSVLPPSVRLPAPHGTHVVVTVSPPR